MRATLPAEFGRRSPTMLLRIVAVLVLALLLPFANAQQKVRVVSPPGEVNLPLWIAQEQDFFGDVDLDVSITHSDDAAARLDELAEQRHDVAIVTIDDIVAFNDRLAKVQRLQAKGYAFVALTGSMLRPVGASSIASIGDLRGRRIAIDLPSPASTHRLTWLLLFHLAGVPTGSYEFVSLSGGADRLAALHAGRADATLLSPAEAAKAVAAGMRVLEPPSRKMSSTVGHVAALSGFGSKNDAVSREFAMACVRAVEWLYDARNRKAAAALLRKHLPNLGEAQALTAIELATSGGDGYSRDCGLPPMQTLAALERAEQRLRPFTGEGLPKPRGLTPEDPIDWSVAANARRQASGLPGTDRDDPSMVAQPLLKAFEYNGDPGKAERALERALRSRKLMGDGNWRLQLMYEGYRQNIGWLVKWETAEPKLAAWRAAYPDSVHARLAETWYWVAEAWRARGDAAANQVPEAAWQRFRAHLAKARAVLNEIGPRAADNPVWHWAMLHVASAQGASSSDRAALFAEAVRREPSFVAHYTTFAHQLTPRWGGSIEEYGAFADAAVKRTQATEGKSMYARLYPQLTYVEHDQDPFEDLRVPWPDLQAGFDDLLARHPNTKTLHLYASFACRAKDAKTFLALLPKLQRRDFPVAGAYSWEHCSEVFLKRT